MKEQFGSSAEPEKKEEDDMEKDSKMDRRAFLKKAGLIAGGIVASGYLGKKLIEGAHDEDVRSEREGEGVIVEKIIHPWEVVSGRALPESYQIRVSVNGKDAAVYVTKEEYASYSVDEKVSIDYDVRDMEIKSIKRIGNQSK